ncbi:MAG: biopolymer transporter ExbD [Enhygromyxa sp.]
MSRRQPREQRDESSTGDANVLPVMNIMFLLIPALLLAMETASMAGVAISPPHSRSEPSEPSEPPQERPLELAVSIASDGFRVAHAAVQVEAEAGAGIDSASPSIPLARPEAPLGDYDRYNYAALEQLAHDFKRKHPHETVVGVSAENDIPAQVLINTLDALRGSDCKLGQVGAEQPSPDDCLFFRPVVTAGR